MPRIISRLSQQFTITRVRLPDFKQIHVVGRVNETQRATGRIDAARHVPQRVALELLELGRAVIKQRSVYTIVTCLPIEADGRPRYRIKSKTENVERVVTEEQISRLA